MLISLVCITAGTVLGFVQPGRYGGSQEDLRALIHPGAAAGFPHSLAQFAHGLARFQGRSVVVLGLLLLILTPVLRVAISIYLFAVQKDRVFTVLTGLVFLLLMVSLLLGRA